MTDLRELIMIGGIALGVTLSLNSNTVEEFYRGYGILLASGISATVYAKKNETEEDRLRYESQWGNSRLK